jgi:hypothetical protein
VITLLVVGVVAFAVGFVFAVIVLRQVVDCWLEQQTRRVR